MSRWTTSHYLSPLLLFIIYQQPNKLIPIIPSLSLSLPLLDKNNEVDARSDSGGLRGGGNNPCLRGAEQQPQRQIIGLSPWPDSSSR